MKVKHQIFLYTKLFLARLHMNTTDGSGVN